MPMSPLVVAVLLASNADAPVPVTVDWSGISDRVIARCGLDQLQNLMLQNLIEAGFAIVEGEKLGEEDRDDSIWASLTSRAGQVLFLARSADKVTQDVLPVPDTCDETFQIDLNQRLLSIVSPHRDIVLARRKIREAEAKRQARPAFFGAESVFVAAGAVYVGPSGLFPHARIGVQFVPVGAIEIWSSIGLGFGKKREVSVLEPELDLRALYPLVRGDGDVVVLAGVSLSALFSRWSHASLLPSDVSLDLRAGVPVSLMAKSLHLHLTLLPYVRRLGGKVFLGDEVLFEAAHVGVLAQVGWTLPL